MYLVFAGFHFILRNNNFFAKSYKPFPLVFVVLFSMFRFVIPVSWRGINGLIFLLFLVAADVVVGKAKRFILFYFGL